MYDYGLSILEQYGLNAESSARTRAALLCRTEKGLVIIRNSAEQRKNFRSSRNLLLQNCRIRNVMVDCYISNQEDTLVSRGP